MNATRPEARTEYSRGSGIPDKGPAGVEILAAAVLALATLGALLLLVAEFTTLFTIRSSAAGAPVRSVGTGSHHTYALVPIALLAIVLATALATLGSRPALLAIGFLGVIALLIALLGDLPDAHTSGLIGTPTTHYVTATSRPSAGFYMETLGAVLLVISCVSGFLLLGPPPRRRREPARSGGRVSAS
jgi:hypothetical protein